MIKKCLACGVEKDMDVKEVWPGADDVKISRTPSDPLMEIDCQPYEGDDDWRRVTVCIACLIKLDADLWISRECWDRIKAITPFEQLPLL